MRARWLVVLLVVLLLVVVPGGMVFAAQSDPQVDEAALKEARSNGWRQKGSPESTTAPPFDLTKITTTEHERRAAHLGDVVVGKFFVVSVKAPVWLPRGTLRDLTDEYIRERAREEGVTLTPVAGVEGRDAAGAEVLEYRGKAVAGSEFDGAELGVIARVIPCDVAGNVVIAAGFGAIAVPVGGLTSKVTNVYAQDVKGLLAPAVGCA